MPSRRAGRTAAIAAAALLALAGTARAQGALAPAPAPTPPPAPVPAPDSPAAPPANPADPPAAACPGPDYPNGAFQISARGTFACSTSGAGALAAGAARGTQQYLTYFGGSSDRCRRNAPLIKSYPSFKIARRSLWLVSTGPDGVGTLRTYNRECTDGREAWLAIDPKTRALALAPAPALWRFVRSRSAGATFCSDFEVVSLAGDRALAMTGRLNCKAGAARNATLAPASGAPAQQWVFDVVFGPAAAA
jgi:hypothetical protein